MNADPNELVSRPEDDQEVETEEGLVEVGAVTDTKGGFFGVSLDGGGGWQRF
jgi:hypothetical protein